MTENGDVSHAMSLEEVERTGGFLGDSRKGVREEGLRLADMADSHVEAARHDRREPSLLQSQTASLLSRDWSYLCSPQRDATTGLSQ